MGECLVKIPSKWEDKYNAEVPTAVSSKENVQTFVLHPQYKQISSMAGYHQETDHSALLEIKAKITDDPLDVMSSWNDTLHFCEWHGVTCGHRHQRVIAVDLQSSMLTGSLSLHVGKLRFLKQLLLQNNSFLGPIPSESGYLHRLQYLFLSDNSFQGEIPSSITGCSSLVVLDVVSNRLEGQIPPGIGSLSKLQILQLSVNNLTGTVPPSLVLLLVFVSVYAFCCRKRSKELITSGDSEISLTNLSYKCLLKATNGFSSENLLGSGTFGIVYHGTLDDDGKVVAIKVFKLEHHGATKSFIAECEVLRNIRHRNLVQVITACSSLDYQGNDFKALVYEYMVNGRLEDWLHPEINTFNGTNYAPRNLNLRQRLDIALALEYLHHNCGAPVVHCDLKPSNVLLDDEMDVQIA
ncbi:hypothetical protein SOVF_120330 [Spinacia oleracea]|nr:hypothetical protein SOVF_120330 [Spinacia oleracea]